MNRHLPLCLATAFALVGSGLSGCSSSSGPNTAAFDAGDMDVTIDTGTSDGATDGGACQASGVSAACTSCLSTHCSTQSQAAQSDCSAVIGCYCNCNLGDTCCVEACASDVTSSCRTGANDLATCATANCPTDCTITPPRSCGGDAGVDSSASDSGQAPDTGSSTGSDAGSDAGPCLGTVIPSGYCLTVLAAGLAAPYAITVDATNVYWIGSDYGTVSKIPIDALPDGGGPTLLATTPNAEIQGALAIAVGSQSVYWTTNAWVYFVGLDGGTPTGLAYGNPGTQLGWGLAVNSTAAVWGGLGASSGKGAIYSTSLVGDVTSTLAGNAFTPNGVTLDDSYVYWTDEGDGTVMKAPLAPDGGAPVVLADGQSSPLAIAVDSNNVYWATNTASGKILKAPLSGVPDGGSPTVLADLLNAPSSITIDATNVYFVAGGAVQVVPISGATGAVNITAGSGVELLPTSAITSDNTNIYFTNGNANNGQVFKIRK